MSIIPLLARGL